MKISSKSLLEFSFLGATFLFLAACGSGTGGGTSGTSSGGGTIGTTVKSTGAIPELSVSDLSLADSKASSSISAAKALLEDEKGKLEEQFSRMGCEVNQQIEEISRVLDEANMNLCMIRIAQKAGFQIGEGEFVYNTVAMPEPPKELKQNLKQDREQGKKEFKEEKEFDAEEDFRPEDSGGFTVRAGLFNGELQVDGGASPKGSFLREFEVSLKADEANSSLSGTIVHIMKHRGKQEGGKATISGSNYSVKDGKWTLGSSSKVTLRGEHQGMWGSGIMEYTTDRGSSSDAIRTYHKGEFTDPHRGVAHKNEGNHLAAQGEKCGCGSGTFKGQVPAIPASDLFKNIPSSIRSKAYQDLASSEAIVAITDNSKFCPTQKGLELASGDTCQVTHTFEECYSISASVLKTDLGGNLISRKYKVIPAGQCQAQKDNLAKLERLQVSEVKVGYSREWDGSTPAGAKTATVDMSKVGFDPMKECFAFEEKVNKRRGGGGELCHEQERRKAIEIDQKKDKGRDIKEGDHENFIGRKESGEEKPK